jgi:RNA polymerase sigma-70 factor (ECF subfamily)
VRSRLNDARRQLTSALRSTVETTHDDSGALTARRRREALELLSSAPRGGFRAALAAAALPDLVFLGPQGQRAHGQETLLNIMESDLDAGVGQRLVNVAAGPRVTILECDLLSPADHPDHCPPGVVWVMSLCDDRIARIRLFHPLPVGASTTTP